MVSNLFALILVPFLFSYAFSQVKIGEIVHNLPVITYNNSDILHALEKEYGNTPSISLYEAKIIVSEDKNFYLIGLSAYGAVKIAVKMAKDSSSDNLFIARDRNSELDLCKGCNSPDCGINFDSKGNPNGCKVVACSNTNENCNHTLQKGDGFAFVERYLVQKKNK
jgi:hypothetical protein